MQELTVFHRKTICGNVDLLRFAKKKLLDLLRFAKKTVFKQALYVLHKDNIEKYFLHNLFQFTLTYGSRPFFAIFAFWRLLRFGTKLFICIQPSYIHIGGYSTESYTGMQ